MPGLNVFIVDDDRDFADSIADVLELRGHEVEVAVSGEEAVERYSKHRFDITFMDVRLPGKNGVDSLLEIRQQDDRAKIVVMTGYSVQQLLDQAVKNGAWAVLHKPLDLNRVLEIVDGLTPNEILIADDDPDFVESLAEVLKAEGHSVLVAASGQETLKKVLKNRVDVLLLDLRMPQMSGIEVYRKLKQAGLGVPTIVLTAYPDEEGALLVDTPELREIRSFTKPIEPSALLAAVRELIGVHRKQKKGK